MKLRKTLESEALLAADYDTKSKTLTVTFRRTEQEVDYFNVPFQTYRELLEAPSAGWYYNAKIRGFY